MSKALEGELVSDLDVGAELERIFSEAKKEPRWFIAAAQGDDVKTEYVEMQKVGEREWRATISATTEFYLDGCFIRQGLSGDETWHSVGYQRTIKSGDTISLTLIRR